MGKLLSGRQDDAQGWEHPLQCWIKRAVFDTQYNIGCQFDDLQQYFGT